jgi:hypothetical protein
MPPRILYIAGYSRCGSTLVDMVLNSSVRIASTGELTYLHDEAAARARMCTCGQPTATARATATGWPRARPVKEPWFAGWNAAALWENSLQAPSRRKTRAPTAPTDKACFPHRPADRADIDRRQLQVRARCGWQALALSRLAGLDVRILHLTRDPRQTVQSYVERGSNWVLEGHRAKGVLESWRPIPGWVLANRIGRRIGHEIGADRYMHLRFEDFLSDPATALRRIGAFIGADLEDTIDRVAGQHPFSAGHMVGGNRARLKPQTITPTAAAPRLPRGHALCLRLVSRPLARELGYG